MVSKDKDLTGQRFGMLTVLEPAEMGKRGVKRWLCRCDCGKLTIATPNNLKCGNKKSCGCLLKKLREEWGSNPACRNDGVSSICFSCIRSAAPPSLQCVWDASHGTVLPEGAKLSEKRVGKVVIKCPQYLSVHDERNMALLKKARCVR